MNRHFLREDTPADALDRWQDVEDPGHKKTEGRLEEAEKSFDSHARSDVSPAMGQAEHNRWSEESRERETQRGRVEGRDFGLNVHMLHPDGKPVYLDYADFKTDTIVDRKARPESVSDAALAKHYEDQRERHIAAYEFTTGRDVFAYEYSPYPSPADIYKESDSNE